MKTFATALYRPPARRTPRFIKAGRAKLDSPAWMDGGSALKGFWERAVTVPATGSPPITYGWYRDFLQYMLDHEWYIWFAKLIAIGETTLGVLLIPGGVRRRSGDRGGVHELQLHGGRHRSTNPLLFALAVLLLLAWRIAGNIGLDRFLLPLLGTPWGRGRGGPP